MMHCQRLDFQYVASHWLDIREQLLDFRLQYRSSLSLPQSVTFGIEIEFAGANYYQVKENLHVDEVEKPNMWHITKDDSVCEGDIGGEVVSPILRDNPQSWRDIDTVCQILQDSKACSSNHTAGHIHLGSQILGNDIEHWICFIKMWAIYEDIIFRFGYGESMEPREWINYYGIPCSSFYREQIRLHEKEWCKDSSYFLYDLCRIDKKRERALEFVKASITGYNKGNTVEVRSPNGTLKKEIWQNNINFFTKLFLYCSSDDCDCDFIQYRFKQLKESDCTIKKYQRCDVDKAMELCGLIFKDEEDFLYFMKQYYKDEYNRPKRLSFTL